MNWNYPIIIRLGAGRVNELADCCATENIKSPLLVTDPVIGNLPMTQEILQGCTDAGLDIAVFSDINSNPTGKNVRDGIAAYKKGGHDGVIALGGGSGLDTGKTIAVMSGQNFDLWQLEDVADNWKKADTSKIPPIIAVPTTAGTGSEVGRAAVIVNENEKRKVIIFHPKMCPGTAILDPQLTTGLPAHLTAATGMDALSHNLEAYCSPVYHPMAEGIATEGIRLVQHYLATAVYDGNNIEARTQMLVASCMGATAFQRGLGAMHALAHPLGAVYNAHHGILNAILMPYVLMANQSAIAHPSKKLARYLDVGTGFDAILQWVLDLRKTIGIPHTLADINIDLAEVQLLSQMAVADPSAATNPIQFTQSQYCNIIENAVNGVL